MGLDEVPFAVAHLNFDVLEALLYAFGLFIHLIVAYFHAHGVDLLEKAVLLENIVDHLVIGDGVKAVYLAQLRDP